MKIEIPTDQSEFIEFFVFSFFKGLSYEEDKSLIEAVVKQKEGQFSKKDEAIIKKREYSKDFEYKTIVLYNTNKSQLHTLNNCYWFDGSEIIKKELLYNDGFF